MNTTEIFDTYTQDRGMEPFNWFSALGKAKRGHLALESPTHKALYTRADSWVTCAVGNLCDIFPRSESGEPEDHTLKNLGNSFYFQVYDGCWDFAIETLHLLEKRSTEMLLEIEENTVQHQTDQNESFREAEHRMAELINNN